MNVFNNFLVRTLKFIYRKSFIYPWKHERNPLKSRILQQNFRNFQCCPKTTKILDSFEFLQYLGYITLPWIWIHLPPTNIREITFVSCNKTRFSWRMRRTYLSHFIIPNIWCLTLDHKSNVFVLCTAKIQPLHCRWTQWDQVFYDAVFEFLNTNILISWDHPSQIRLLSSDEDTQTPLYIFLFVAINALEKGGCWVKSGNND